MTVARETIEAAISRWERKARAELYLSENLHPKARAWLVEEMMLRCSTQTVINEDLSRRHGVSDLEYDRIASEPPPRKGKNKG